MKAAIYCRVSIILIIALILPFLIIGCGDNSSKRTEIQNYLESTGIIIDEFAAIAIKVSNLYETSGQHSPAEIATLSNEYSKEYNALLGRFILIECPNECSELREHVIDACNYAAKELVEYGAAHSTGDMEHLVKSQSLYHDAQKSIALASGEWDRLKREYK